MNSTGRRSNSGEDEGATGLRKDGKREKPRATSDIKLDDVTITVILKPKGKEEEEEFSPFKPSKRIQSSPIISERVEVDVGDESEGGEVLFGIGDSEQSTPIVGRNDKGWKYLAWRAVEINTRAIYGKPLPAGSEMAESARKNIDAPNSVTEREEITITMSEMKGFTQALSGAVQMLNALVKKLNLDKERSEIGINERIRKIGDVIKGIVMSLDQCIGQTRRRRKMRTGHEKMEGVVWKVGKRGVVWDERRENTGERVAADYPKRKMVS